MKELPLRNGGSALVDDDIFERFKDRKWYRSAHGYAICNSGYGRKGRYTEILHQLIVGKAPGKTVTDHRNGNRLDCRRENLRFVTRRINNLNSCVRKNVIRHQVGWRVRFKLYELEVSVTGLKTEEEATSIAALLRGSLIYHELTKGGSHR